MPISTSHPELPTERDSDLARESIRRLGPYLQADASVRVSATGAGSSEATVELPPQAVRLLMRLLGELARGNAVTVLPVNAELTTQQAADMLGMSRTYFVRLLDAGELAFTRTGTHRRIRLRDLLAFKAQREAARLDAIDRLVTDAEDLGMDA